MTLKDHNSKLISAVCACIFMFVLEAGRLNAQATAGIVGTVTDMSGAAIAGARAQVKNVGTGVTQNATAVATNPFAGVSLNSSVGRITATNGTPRQIQLALKIVF
jgi:hypothetical protein